MFTGEEVTLEDMMFCRDRRANIQKEYIAQYHCPILSFALNIPGPIKTNSKLHACFTDAVNSITAILSKEQIHILDSITFNDKTGDELLLVFDADATFVKTMMTKLEENTPLGRLFDIDIIDTNGEKLSRSSYRKCLICNLQAQECSRSRAHSIEEMQNKILELLENAGY